MSKIEVMIEEIEKRYRDTEIGSLRKQSAAQREKKKAAQDQGKNFECLVTSRLRKELGDTSRENEAEIEKRARMFLNAKTPREISAFVQGAIVMAEAKKGDKVEWVDQDTQAREKEMLADIIIHHSSRKRTGISLKYNSKSERSPRPNLKSKSGKPLLGVERNNFPPRKVLEIGNTSYELKREGKTLDDCCEALRDDIMQGLEGLKEKNQELFLSYLFGSTSLLVFWYIESNKWKGQKRNFDCDLSGPKTERPTRVLDVNRIGVKSIHVKANNEWEFDLRIHQDIGPGKVYKNAWSRLKMECEKVETPSEIETIGTMA